MAQYIETSHVNRNNYVGATGGDPAATVQTLRRVPAHFHFSIKYTGADGTLALAGMGAAVGLSVLGLGSPAYEPDGVLYVEWHPGTNAGTVKEKYYYRDSFFGAPILLREIDNVDPGYGNADVGAGSPDAGRPGPQYALVMTGAEYEIYRGLVPGAGQIKIASAPMPRDLDLAQDPLRLAMSAITNIVVRNVQFGGAINPTAHYTLEMQEADFGEEQDRLFLRFRQLSRYYPSIEHGLPLDVVAPPIPYPATLPGLVFGGRSASLVLNDNDAVSAVEDESGNSNDASQGTSGSRPVFKANVYDSKPAIRFDGANDFLTTASAIGGGGNPTLSFFVVVKPDDTTTQHCALGFGDSTNTVAAFALFFGFRGNGVPSIEFAGNKAAIFQSYTAGLQWLVVTKTPGAINTTTRLWRNGVEQAIQGGSAADVPGLTNTALTLGRFANNNGYYFDGDLVEAWVCVGHAITADERANLADYVAAQYGI